MSDDAMKPWGAAAGVGPDGAVTVVIPTYQRASLLGETIDSVVHQLSPGDRVIVVNDGSTDHTAEVARSFGARVSLIERSNGGFSLAANDGIHAADTEYVWVFGDDDQMLPGAIDSLRASLAASPDAAAVAGSWARADRDERGAIVPTGARLHLPDLSERGLLPELAEGNFVNGGVCLMRTAAVRTLGGFNPKFLRSQDYELALRIALRWSICLFHGEPIVNYVQLGQTRGAARERFPASLAPLKWLKYDQILFMDLLAALPPERLGEGHPSAASNEALGHINKARAAASKLLPIHCLDALLHRALTFGHLPLSAIERQRLRGLPELGAWYGFGTSTESPAFLNGLRQLGAAGTVGEEIAALLSALRPAPLRRAVRSFRH